MIKQKKWVERKAELREECNPRKSCQWMDEELKELVDDTHTHTQPLVTSHTCTLKQIQSNVWRSQWWRQNGVAFITGASEAVVMQWASVSGWVAVLVVVYRGVANSVVWWKWSRVNRCRDLGGRCGVMVVKGVLWTVWCGVVWSGIGGMVFRSTWNITRLLSCRVET